MKLPKGICDIPTTLPPFNGDIPYESIALIGYSTCVYKRAPEDTVKSVALNAVWVVVLDCPPEA